MIVASARGGHQRVDGTSFAAPFVAAALAMKLGDNGSPADAADRLRTSAKDLGATGRDAIFGWGLVQFEPPPGC